MRRKGAGMVPDFRILFLLFLIYSAVGWLCESVYCSVPARKFINRGFLNGPLCPIYGVGALLADALLTPVAWSLPLLFLGGAIVTSVLEYFTGWLLETLFHAKWWDYSNKKWNLHGRVCLCNSVLFGLMCVILLRVLHPLLLGLVLRIPDPALTVLCAVLAAAFLADLVFSVRGALQLRGKLEALQEILDELRERTETALEEQKTAVRAAVGTWEQRAQTGREEAVERLRERQARLESSLRFAHRRLLAAFPTMRTRRGREALTRLREAAQAGREKLRRRRGGEE